MHIREQTIEHLKQHDIGDKFSFPPGLPKASVLIPLIVKNGELFTLMTLRSKELRTNAGEVCFPGGKRDPSDRDDVHTALREAEEEIGLPPDEVQVVCTLYPVLNKRGLLVTPVVAFIDESFSPRPNPAEVSAIFCAPLELFISKKSHRCLDVFSGQSGFKHFFHYDDLESGNSYHIWGLTALLAVLVSTLALRKKPEFDVFYDIADPLPFFKQALHQRISKL